MKITLCGSMSFFDQMSDLKKELKILGHEVLMPEKNELSKAEHIKDHYEKIKNSDAILVVNCDKGEKKNYIGASVLMEMGFAFVLGKKIFVLNDPSNLEFYQDEITPLEPVVLNGIIKNMVIDYYSGLNLIDFIDVGVL